MHVHIVNELMLIGDTWLNKLLTYLLTYLQYTHINFQLFDPKVELLFPLGTPIMQKNAKKMQNCSFKSQAPHNQVAEYYVMFSVD